MTKCDRFWWKQNKVYFIAMLCTFPVALFVPALSILIPILALYSSCDKFFVFHNIGATHHDSIRFILSMPFSRTQIFNTYLKGLITISIGYTLAIGTIRAVLAAFNLSIVFWWGNSINYGFDYLTYMLVLITSLLITNFFIMMLINNFSTITRGSNLFSSLFIAFILICLIPIFKGIWNMEKVISEHIVYNILIIFYLIIIGFLIAVLILTIKKERAEFVEGVSKCKVKS